MPSMTVTAKVQIRPTNKEKELLVQTMDIYRQACNFVSEYIFATHDLKQMSLNNNLYYKLREVYGLRSQMAQSVIKTVVARYKTILANQKKWIRANFKKPQLDLVWNRDYSLNRDVFSLNTLEGRIKVAYFKQGMERYFEDDCKFGTARLVVRNDKYYLHIPVTFSIKESKLEDICNVVGVDRGINFVVATYDSAHKTGFVNGRAIKQKRARYKKVRAQLQKRRTKSARKRLKKIGSRENRWMQDTNHCITKALIEANPKHTLFILEDLDGIRNATEKVRLKDRYVAVSWAFYDLEQKLTYKAQMNECSVIQVDPAYTSQCCPKCGYTKKANRNKKTHVFCCKNCGYTSNDDRIGAMNLYRAGINYLASLDTVAKE